MLEFQSIAEVPLGFDRIIIRISTAVTSNYNHATLICHYPPNHLLKAPYQRHFTLHASLQ